MNIKHYEDYEAMSNAGAEFLLDLIINEPYANICLATGDSPRRMYEILTEKINNQHVDVSHLTFTKLDEWCGLKADDDSTCEWFIQKYVIQPLNIKKEQLISFDNDAFDYEAEAARIHELIMKNPIDCCILGLGRNGHLGLNEPCEKLIPDTHVIDLDELSKHHSMLKGKAVEQGITLGLYEILNAKRILMLISGQNKTEIYKQLMEKKVTTALPASFLWLHDHTECLINKKSVITI